MCRKMSVAKLGPQPIAQPSEPTTTVALGKPPDHINKHHILVNLNWTLRPTVFRHPSPRFFRQRRPGANVSDNHLSTHPTFPRRTWNKDTAQRKLRESSPDHCTCTCLMTHPAIVSLTNQSSARIHFRAFSQFVAADEPRMAIDK